MDFQGFCGHKMCSKSRELYPFDLGSLFQKRSIFKGYFYTNIIILLWAWKGVWLREKVYRSEHQKTIHFQCVLIHQYNVAGVCL